MDEAPSQVSTRVDAQALLSPPRLLSSLINSPEQEVRINLALSPITAIHREHVVPTLREEAKVVPPRGTCCTTLVGAHTGYIVNG